MKSGVYLGAARGRRKCKYLFIIVMTFVHLLQSDLIDVGWMVGRSIGENKYVSSSDSCECERAWLTKLNNS